MMTRNYAVVVALTAIMAGPLGLAPTLASDTEAPAAGSQTSIEDIGAQTREWLNTLQSYAADQRDEAIARSGEILDQLDRQIAALQSRIDRRWDRMDQATREKTRAALNQLQKQRVEVAEWYGRLKSSSNDAWSRIRQGFSDAYRNLNQAWEDAEQEFRSDP